MGTFIAPDGERLVLYERRHAGVRAPSSLNSRGRPERAASTPTSTIRIAIAIAIVFGVTGCLVANVAAPRRSPPLPESTATGQYAAPSRT